MVTSALIQSTITKILVPTVCLVPNVNIYSLGVVLTGIRFKLWGSEISDKPPEISYEEVMESDKGVARWTSKIVSQHALKV